MDDFQIKVFASIQPGAGGAPACVVRWMLGTGTELPHVDDVFDVRLTLCAADKTRIAQVGTRSVAPRKLLMLDTPRKEDSIPRPDGGRNTWQVAVEPTGPVDPNDAAGGDIRGKPFGVCHMLSETENSRMAWRAARVIGNAMTARRPATRAFAAFDDAALHGLARRFAVKLVRSRIRPRTLFPHVRAAYATLAAVAGPRAELHPTQELFHLGASSVAERVAHATLLMNALADQATFEELDRVFKEREQVRQHLRMRALHGGELIDYWNDPDGTGPLPQRGLRYPAAEVVACGCTIPLAATDVQQWVADKRQVLVEVVQRPRPPHARSDQPLTSIEHGGPPGDIVDAGDRGAFTDGTWWITWQMLNSFVKTGRSIAIPPPVKAWVDYAMASSDEAASNPDIRARAAGMSFATGDGRLDIVVEPPAQSDSAKTVAAYNVYGVWEGAVPTSSPLWDTARPPSLTDLRPWLMTRRYWYKRDLDGPFPPVGGAVNPLAAELLSAPPWEPLLRQPDSLVTDTKDSLPLKDPGKGRFTADLRRGMQPGAAPSGLPPGWDLALPVDTTWTPERDRNGAPFDPSLKRPQRYRFWVTSVDAFDQESDPVPVEAHDAEAAEALSYLFEPRRRTPIPGPPAGTDTLVLSYDEAAATLEVRFQTPPEAGVAGITGAGTAAPKIDKNKLVATVGFFRRRLVSVKQAAARPFIAEATSAADLPQWQDAVRGLTADGWRAFGAPSDVAAPAGDTWSARVRLTPRQHGWEYLALVCFSAVPEFANFWTGNIVRTATTGRTLLNATTVDGKKVYKPELVSETPRASNVVSTGAVAVVHQGVPRTARLDAGATRVLPATPVPAVPGVRRDLVLLRLLTQPFARGGGPPLPPAEWRGTKVPLTLGQAAMCDTALLRTSPDTPLDLDSANLAVTRDILARSFVAVKDVSTPLRQHATLGFRGLLDLQWRYQPIEVQPGDEAEATRFRIYTVRGPRGAQTARAFATAGGTGQLSGATGYDLVTLDKGAGDGWDTIATHFVPTLARIAPAAGAGEPAWANVVAATTTPAGGFHVELAPLGAQPLPATASIDLFASQPTADVALAKFDEPQNPGVLLPIGGGHAEALAWWIVSVSAKGIEARGPSVPFWAQEFEETIEPLAPHAVTVRPPWDNVTDVLDPARYAAWLPSAVASLADAQNYPRLVLGWAADDESTGAIVIERDPRQVMKPKLTLFADALSVVDAIKAIESNPETQPLDAAALETIQGSPKTWLLGFPVDAVADPSKITLVGTDRTPRLKATDGLLFVRTDEVVGNGARRPGFIDYYGQNNDDASAMDCNWDFSYRVKAYLDLGAALPPGARFLFSMPTEWTPYCLPETPPMKLRLGDTQPTESSVLPAPSVRFRLKAGARIALQAAMVRIAAETDHKWEYRVLVRRKLDVPMPSTQGAFDPVWVDVGTPLRLSESSGSKDLVDPEVDRTWGGEARTVTYGFFVQQFFLSISGETITEKLVRAIDSSAGAPLREVPVLLPVPSRPDVEVEVTQEVFIE